ncbi:hypothetical protein Dimus_023632 [Dionaea muscipula]
MAELFGQAADPAQGEEIAGLPEGDLPAGGAAADEPFMQTMYGGEAGDDEIAVAIGAGVQQDAGLLPFHRSGPLSASGCLVFFQPRHQLHQIAGLGADIELGGEDAFPAVLHGAGAAGQGEKIGAVRDPADGAGLHGGRTDMLIAQHAEKLAKTDDFLLQHTGEGFGRYVPPGDAGAACGNNDIDLGIGNPAAEHGDDRIGVIAHKFAVDELVLGRFDTSGQHVTRTILLKAPCIGNRQDGDIDRDEGAREIHGRILMDRRGTCDSRRIRAVVADMRKFALCQGIQAGHRQIQLRSVSPGIS